MAKAKKESTAENKPAVEVKEKKIEPKVEKVIKPEVQEKVEEPKLKKEKSPCDDCSIVFDSAPCKSCVIYKRKK